MAAIHGGEAAEDWLKAERHFARHRNEVSRGWDVRALILLVVLCSTAPLYAAEEMKVNGQNEDENKQIVRRLFEDCLNSGKLALLGEFIDPEYAGAGGQKGPAAFAAPITNLLRAFSDIHYVVEDLTAEEERVAVKWTWKGTHTGDFAGFAVTHKSVANDGMAIFHLRNGKITRSSIQTDRLGFLQALGVVPLDVVPQPAVPNRK